VHWVNAAVAVPAEVRLYETLFTTTNPAAATNFAEVINPASICTMSQAVVEPALAAAAPESRYQFERLGYFVADRHDHTAIKPVFNRTVTLRDTWAK